jgi:uncharacterized membrane protein
MSESSASTFRSDFKRFFLRGLVILLPSILTLWIVVKAYQFVDSAIAEPINQSVRVAMAQVAPYWSPLQGEFDPTNAQLNAAVAERAVARGAVNRDQVRIELRDSGVTDASEDQINAAIAERAAARHAVYPDTVRAELRQKNIELWWAEHWYMNLIGLIVAIVAVYVAGRLLGGFLGKRLYRHIERFITSLPVFKQVYPYVKQIVDFLFSDEKTLKFNRVVAVEYPRKGTWSVGFQTGAAIKKIDEHAGECVTVFIPSSPTPFTGYAVCLPREEVLQLPVTVEEALRFIVSGGVLVPGQNTPELPNAAIPALAASTELPEKLVSSNTARSADGAEKDPRRMSSAEPTSQARPRLAPDV